MPRKRDVRKSNQYLFVLKSPLNEMVLEKMETIGYNNMAELVRELLRNWINDFD